LTFLVLGLQDEVRFVHHIFASYSSNCEAKIDHVHLVATMGMGQIGIYFESHDFRRIYSVISSFIF